MLAAKLQGQRRAAQTSRKAPWTRSSMSPLNAAQADAQRMRILMVNSTLHIGGAENVAASLAEHINRERFEVTACYLRQNGVVGEKMIAAGVDLVPVPGHAGGRTDRLTSLKLMRLIRERRIQLLHTHDVHGFIDASLCRTLMPRLRHVHTFHFGNYPHREARYRHIERLLWRRPDALVAVGHEQARSIRQLYGIAESRLRVIWNGVDSPIPRIAEQIGAFTSLGVPLITSISTLIEQKGLDHLLSACAQLKSQGAKFHLLIVGEGHLRPALEAQSRSLGLENVVSFVGWIANASECALPACDVFVQSSLWEAMSVVVLEAMACGKPMVVTSVGENTHVVRDSGTGFIVPPGDSGALAAALFKLINDPELQRRMSDAARSRYLELFTTRHMVDAYESLYADVISE